VNSVLAAFVPPGVVTTTLAVPAVPEGVVQVAEVAEATLTAVHAAPPTVIPVAPVKLVPVIVTGVPPAVEPDVGEIDVTVGGGDRAFKVTLFARFHKDKVLQLPPVTAHDPAYIKFTIVG
jgi:hypothetical protein